MNINNFLKTTITVLLTCGPMLNQTSAQTINIGPNQYAFQYTLDSDYGMFFNSTNTQYELRNGLATPVWAVDANDGKHQTDVRFDAGADILIDANRYAFRFADAPNYGLFFNATGTRYEFRTNDASPVSWIDANAGTAYFKGAVGVGRVPISPLDVAGVTDAQQIRFNGQDGNYRFLQSLTADDNAEWTFRTGTSTPVLHIKSNDRIGVGTVSPSSIVDIKGPTNANTTVLKATVQYTGASPGPGANAIIATSEPGLGAGVGVLGYGNYRGVSGTANASTYTGTSVGVYGSATGSAGTRIGIFGRASGGATNWAGYFEGNTNTIGAIRTSYSSGQYGELSYAHNGTGGLLINSRTGGTWADISFQSNGTTRMFMEWNGNLGLGVVPPTEKLHVNGHILLNDDGDGIIFSAADATNVPMIRMFESGTSNGDRMVIAHSSSFNDWGLQYRDADDSWHFLQDGFSMMTLNSNTVGPGYYMTVDGKILCEELRVESSGNWPDYVFHEDYQLMPLDDLKTEIQKNKHLPGIPSATEISDNGLHIGEIQKKMMEKIEELTLYVIQLKEENIELRSMITETGK